MRPRDDAFATKLRGFGPVGLAAVFIIYRNLETRAAHLIFK